MSVPSISRRSLLRGTIVTLIGGVAGYFVARTSSDAASKNPAAASGYGPSTTGGSFLASLSQVPPLGGGLILTGALVVLVREADESVRGFSATCTHQGCTVNSVVDGVIACPCHGSRFSAQTGVVLMGPATRPLPKVPVVVRAGNVYSA